MIHNFIDITLSITQKAMHKMLAILSLFYLTSCTGQSSKNTVQNFKEEVDTKYKWTQVTGNAAFPKGYNFQLFSIRDTLWAMHHAGIWFS
jgi:hypothetical protein